MPGYIKKNMPTYTRTSGQRKDLVKVYKPKLSQKSYDHKLLMALKRNVYQSEKKFIDTTITGYGLYGTGNVLLINGLVQGTDENTRIGRQLTMHSIYLKALVDAYSSTGIGAIRTMVVLDQEVPQVSGAGQALTMTDLLVTNDMMSLNNLNNRKRFKILFNQVDKIAGATNVSGFSIGGDLTTAYIEFYKKVDIPVEFNSGNAGTIADFTKNALYLITFMEGLATAGANVDGFTRVRFKDN